MSRRILACQQYSKRQYTRVHSPVNSQARLSWAIFLCPLCLTLGNILPARVPQCPNHHCSGDCAKFLSPFSFYHFLIVLRLSPTPVHRLGARLVHSVVGKQDNTSATWCSTPAQGTISMPVPDSLRRHLASFPLAFVLFNMHLSASWSLPIVNWHFSEWGFKSGTAHTTVTHCLCVVA